MFEVQALTDRQVGSLLKRLAVECDSMQWAVAWARLSDVAETAIRYRSKFTHLVIGTHFYQTSPDLLEKFLDLRAARMMLPTGGTFHPKVYLFRIGDQTAAVVGSHNLTRAAFATNTEAALLVRGPASSQPIAQLSRFVKQEWLRAKPIAEHLYQYKVQHLASEAAREELESFDENLHVRPPKCSDTQPLEWTWNEFMKEVRGRDALKMAGRLSVLEGAQALYASRKSFAQFTPLERKAVTGTFHKNEGKLDEKPWAWFGSMVGHGDFRKRVNQPSPQLAAAIDAIPLRGEVKEVHYRRFTAHLKRAFAQAKHTADYAIATRLLAIKRPDVFVGINSRNERPLCAAFGITRSHLDVDSYWELLAVPISKTRWWRAHAPASGLARRIWHGRAALLDCVYYQPFPGDTP